MRDVGTNHTEIYDPTKNFAGDAIHRANLPEAETKNCSLSPTLILERDEGQQCEKCLLPNGLKSILRHSPLCCNWIGCASGRSISKSLSGIIPLSCLTFVP